MNAECEVITSRLGWHHSANANKFDFIAASMSITEERKKTVDFTDPYYTNKLQFVGPKTPRSLLKGEPEGKAVGAQRAPPSQGNG